MYHHLKIAEGELKDSGKQGTEVKRGMGFRKIGFTVDYHGDSDKLIRRIVYNVKKYGKFIPKRHDYVIKKADLLFYDRYNDITWSVEVVKNNMVRYLNFSAQCSR